jgi:diacylglycerol kinase
MIWNSILFLHVLHKMFLIHSIVIHLLSFFFFYFIYFIIFTDNTCITKFADKFTDPEYKYSSTIKNTLGSQSILSISLSFFFINYLINIPLDSFFFFF